MKYFGMITVFLVFSLGLPAGEVFAQARQDESSLRFGIMTTQWPLSWEEIQSLWQEIEELGFDSAWVADHILPPSGDESAPILEAWTLLAALAEKTSRLRIGCLVTGNTFRHPALVAKMATTIDHLSGGRLELGLGAGWYEREHHAYGIPFYTAKERAERLREATALIRTLWSDEPANFRGKYYQLDNAPFAPKPVQRPHPPIVIGGAGRKWILPTVAQYADTWNVLYRTPQAVADLNAVLDSYCHNIGRDPQEIERSLFLPIILTESPMRSWVYSWLAFGYKWYFALSTWTWPQPDIKMLMLGTPDQVKAQIEQYREAGITNFIFAVSAELGDPHATIRLFASEVMPTFR